MNREEIVDNIVESMRRRETVTLTVRWVSGYHPAGAPVRFTGRILAYATHYTGKRAKQIVLDVDDPAEPLPLVIGVGMITAFQVGRPPRPAPQPATPRSEASP